MTNSWLPQWFGTVWVVVFVAVLGVHLGHLASMRGRSRFWHFSHVVMALGMIDMYWPSGHMPVGRIGGVVVFAVAAVGLAAVAVLDGRRSGWTRWWVIAGVDLALMAWMFQMTATRVVAVTVLAVVWFAAETVGWATGRLLPASEQREAVAGTGGPNRVSVPAGPATPPMSSDPVTSAPATSAVATLARPVAGPAAVDPDSHHGRLHRRSLRLTLPAMSVGMGYMFLAMQFGGGMTGM